MRRISLQPLFRTAATPPLAWMVLAALLVLVAGLLRVPTPTLNVTGAVLVPEQGAVVVVDAPDERRAPGREAGEPAKKRNQRYEVEPRQPALGCEHLALWRCLTQGEPRIERRVAVASAPLYLRDPGLRIARGQAPPL